MPCNESTKSTKSVNSFIISSLLLFKFATLLLICCCIVVVVVVVDDVRIELDWTCSNLFEFVKVLKSGSQDAIPESFEEVGDVQDVSAGGGIY